MTDDPTDTPSGGPGRPEQPSEDGAGGLSPHEIAAARRKVRLGFEPDDPDDHDGDQADAPGSLSAAPPPPPPAAAPSATPAHLESSPAAPEPAPEPPPAPEPDPEPLLVANCSGFYGDRLSAAREMVEGGPIDVLTGDWLAELTMLILAKARLKDPDLGFATTFLTQMEQVLGTCLAEGIVVVSNAGGLNPAGCAEALHQLASRLGLSPRIAHVEGDDLMPRLAELQARGIDLRNLDTGESLESVGIEPMTANAYLGAWGIADALDRGADVVITGRVTDAAVVVGPAASRFGWARTDWDALAGAVTAGHLIECGPQVTGGNFAFFGEVPELERPGFPIAEIHHDGSFVVTKHPGSGGLVSVDTVTAQLLYEVQGLGYHNPDVIVAFDSLQVDQEGPDRVRVSGAVGLPAPDSTKVAVNYPAGYRNSMTFVMTGLDIEAKADLAERTLWSLVPGGRDGFDAVEIHLRRSDQVDPPTNEDALAELRVTVMDRDREKVGRAFSRAVIEMVLSSYPGLFTTSPPGDASSFGVYWPALIPDDIPHHEVVLDGERTTIPPLDPSAREKLSDDDAFTYGLISWNAAAGPASTSDRGRVPETLAALLGAPQPPDGQTVRAPFGAVIGARSGDKGGNANLGVWARRDDVYVWLHRYLTVERLRELMPAETEGLDVRRFDLPNLRALNFVVMGLLGRGVAASTRLDPQAKGLGEYLRAKVVDLPARLLDAPVTLDHLPPAPLGRLSAMQFTAEHDLFRKTVRNLVQHEIDPHIDEWERTGFFPAHELFPKLAAVGILGLEYDPAYGGQGADHSYTVVYGEEMGRAGCGGIPMAVSVQTDMATPSLHRFGSHDLKLRYLAPAVRGEMVAAIAVTEPDAGSDVAGIRTRAVRDGDEWVINGTKLYITNGTQADWLCLLARTSELDDSAAGRYRGMSQIVVPTASPGFSVSRKLDKLGNRSSDTAELSLVDVRVPVANTIGEIGRGFQQQMAQFQNERMIAAYMAVGGMQVALERTIAYVNERKVFGQPLGSNQHVQFALAELVAEVDVARHYNYACAEAYCRGEDTTRFASIAKLQTGRLNRRVADVCLQFHGGIGYMEETWTARYFRDSRLLSIGGGADEVMLRVLAQLEGIGS